MASRSQKNKLWIQELMALRDLEDRETRQSTTAVPEKLVIKKVGTDDRWNPADFGMQEVH